LNHLKQVLIISYYFTPCNLTAAQRIKGWADHLSKYGYYPTVITRNWDHRIESPKDVLKDSGEGVVHEQHENYEVYRLPYKSSKRDRLFTNGGGGLSKIRQKFLTLWGLIMENYSIKVIPHKNLYHFADEWLTKNPQVKSVVISANPFDQFSFGYKLRKRHSIQWIADYRDDWTTSELKEMTKGGLHKLVRKLQAKSEKKWVGSSSLITSVSSHYVKKIESFVGVQGQVLLNGFDRLQQFSAAQSDQFQITYNGSLYDTQKVEPFLEAIQNLIRKGYNIRMNFPGTGFNVDQNNRIERLTEEIKDHVFVTDRIPREEVIEIQKNSDLLLMLSHEGLKGIPSSKLYEYISTQKPVLLFPNDGDIIEETLLDIGNGIICDSMKQIEDSIEGLINGKLKITVDKERLHFYSREFQTGILAKLLDELND